MNEATCVLSARRDGHSQDSLLVAVNACEAAAIVVAYLLKRMWWFGIKSARLTFSCDYGTCKDAAHHLKGLLMEITKSNLTSIHRSTYGRANAITGDEGH